MAVGQKELLIAAGFNAAICLAVLLGFAILRRLKFCAKFYAPKRYLKGRRKRPKRLPNSFVSWIFTLFQYNETEMLEVAGTDAVMFLRISAFGVQLFAVLALLTLTSVLPTNLTGDAVDVLLAKNANKTEGEESDFAVTDLDRLSVANIAKKSSKLWVHVAACWVVTLYTLWLLHKYHKDAVKLRIQHMAGNRKGAELHSVLVFDIPGCRSGTMLNRICQCAPKFIRKRIEDSVDKGIKIAARGISQGLRHLPMGSMGAPSSPRGDYEQIYEPMEVDAWAEAAQKLSCGITVEEFVKSEFEEVYPDGEVVDVAMVKNQSELEPLIAKYDKIKTDIEDILDDWSSKLRRRKKVKQAKIRIIPFNYGAWGRAKYGDKPVKVDKLTFLSDRLARLKEMIEEKQIEFEDDFMPTAFITFRTRHSQVVSATSLHHHDKSAWRIVAAPSPAELVWENLKWRNWERSLRRMLMWALFAALVCWFMIPIAAIQAMIEIKRLDQTPVIGDIVKVPFIRGILTALLPGLVLKIFLAFLPAILAWMNKLQGMVSMSEIDYQVAKKYFIFQVLTVFFGSFIAGSLTSQFNKLKDDPGSIVEILGTAAPQTASFFISFILVEAFFTTPLGLLRVSELVIFYILSKISATERSKNRLWQDQDMTYGDVVPEHTIIILLGLTFATVNPLVTVVALVFFILSMLVWRYQMLYVYQESYQSGGKLWTEVFQQTLVGLLIMQLMMIGLLGIVKKFAFATLVFPMPVVTLYFWIRMDSLFKEPLEVLSLRDAANLDCKDREDAAKSLRSHAIEKGANEENEEEDNYVSPCFDLDEERHESLLREVQSLQMWLETGTPPDVEMLPTQDDEYYSADDEIYEDATSAPQSFSSK